MNTLDLATPMGALFGLLPEVILTVTACIVFLVAAWRQGTPEDSRLAGWISLAGVVLSGAALSYLWLGGFAATGVPHMVALDPFRYASLGILLLAVGLTIGVSLGYMEREGLLAPEYYGLVLLAAIGMMLLAGAVDFVVVFLGLAGS